MEDEWLLQYQVGQKQTVMRNSVGAENTLVTALHKSIVHVRDGRRF
jgi:hypothetical protein